MSNLLSRITSRFFKFLLKKNKCFIFSGDFILKGVPIIDVHRDARIFIGENVTLNSRNRGYHAGMHSPVKIMADRAGAKISIGKNSRIHGSCLHAQESITIGDGCLIAANCQILDANGHDLSFPDVEHRIYSTGRSFPVIIGNNVWVGLGCVILPGSVIGDGVVIAAGSVVRGEIAPMSLVAGNPAKVIKSFL